MPLLIDAHEDIAYNVLNFNRDITLSVKAIRKQEAGTDKPAHAGGEALLGWPEYQKGQVGLVFGTLFLSPKKYAPGEWDNQAYKTPTEACRMHHQQIDTYERLCDDHSDAFRLVRNQSELASIIKPWLTAQPDDPNVTRPVGILMLMEGAEGVAKMSELEVWWERGVRMIGPVWSGGKYCGGTREPGPVTQEGFELMHRMAELGFILDLSHMSEQSAVQAVDFYEGPVVATHANCRALLPDFPFQRHLTDDAIHHLIERDGVIGVIPFNRFLKTGWKESDGRGSMSLSLVADHIDHICQLAGNANHAAVGTDFDGGFGVSMVPQEVDSIADLQKLAPILAQHGYNEVDIQAIFSENWLRVLQGALPH